MSNINAKNINSENITVKNLNVSYINGFRIIGNGLNANTNGYYVPCQDCNYQGPEICDCGNDCNYVSIQEEIDECDSIATQNINLNNLINGVTNNNNTNNVYTGSSNEPLLTQYFINSPPAPFFLPPITTDLLVYIPFIYPDQIIWGGTGYVPVINSMTISYTADVSGIGIVTDVPILMDISGVQFINYYGISSNAITGLILSKNYPCRILTPSGPQDVSNNMVVSTLFPQDNNGSTRAGSIYRNAYIYNDSNLQNIVSNYLNNVTIYYSNFQIPPNKSIIHFDIFKNAGPPSDPSVNTITQTNLLLQVSLNPPSHSDYTNYNLNIPIVAYIINYTISNNIIAYGFTPTSGTVISQTSTVNIPSIYSDSTYTLSIQSQNASNSNYGLTSTAVFNTKPYDISTNLLRNTFTRMTLPYFRVYRAYDVSTNYVQVICTRDLSFNDIPFYINDFYTRGNLGLNNPIMNLSVDISGGNILSGGSVVSTVTGPSLNYYGFPNPNQNNPITPITRNNITVYPGPVNDLSGSYLAGYYLSSTCNISLPSSSFRSFYQPYIINLTRKYGSNVVNITPSSEIVSFSYYYDIPSNNPLNAIINSFAITTNSNSLPLPIYQVTGVNILCVNSIYLNFNATFTGLDSYFYNPNIITYKFAQNIAMTDISENNIVNLSTIGIRNSNTNPIQSPCSFTGIIPYNIKQTFSTDLSAIIFITNTRGQTVQSNNISFNVIFDYRSYYLVYNTLAVDLSHAILGPNTYTHGCRIIGDVVNRIFSPAIYYPDSLNNSGTSYSDIPYDNSMNITNTQELQIVNGSFVTPLNPYAYLDYNVANSGITSYLGSPYTSISNYNYSSAKNINFNNNDYKFVTFAWNIMIPPIGSIYPYLSINIRNIRVNNNILAITNSNILGSDFFLDIYGLYKFLLFYRTEEKNGIIPLDPSSNNYSSYWGDANSARHSIIYNTNTYYSSAQGMNGRNGSVIYSSNSSNNLVNFQCRLPKPITNTINPNGNTFVLYVKVGLPVNIDASFETLQCSYTS